MLVRASALIVGPPDKAGRMLADAARRIGFSPIHEYRGLDDAARRVDETPLMFFLCAPVKDTRALKPVADTIRFSTDMRLRFLPLIYFSPEPSVECIKDCIQMGFDDVIALPYASGDLGERIGRQVGRTQTYYETATYFGPDRRNRIGETRSLDSDRGGGQFRKIEIVRTDAGVDVLRDDFQVVL